MNAARAQGRPMMVMAMITAATSQPNAIHAPPSTIQTIFRSSETGDMGAICSVPWRSWKSKKASAELNQITIRRPEPDLRHALGTLD